LRKGAAEVEAGEVEAARAVPVAAVRAAQAREPVGVQTQQAERARIQRPEGRKRNQALAKEEELRTLAGRVIPLTRQTGRFRDGLRHRIRLQHPERTGSIADEGRARP
jgi:hypothetical protein